jgi:hypothetical protein
VWSLVGSPAGPGQPPTAGPLLSSGPAASVALINKSSVRACQVEVTVAGAAPGARAELHRLASRGSVASGYGITWRGQSFAGSRDGLPRGALDIGRPAPAGGGAYSVRVPAGEAALLVVPLTASGAAPLPAR